MYSIIDRYLLQVLQQIESFLKVVLVGSTVLTADVQLETRKRET